MDLYALSMLGWLIVFVVLGFSYLTRNKHVKE